MNLYNQIKKLPNELIDRIYLYTDFITIFEHQILLKNKIWLLKKIFITDEIKIYDMYSYYHFNCICNGYSMDQLLNYTYKLPIEKIFNIDFTYDFLDNNNKIINYIINNVNNKKYLKEMLLYIKDNSDIRPNCNIFSYDYDKNVNNLIIDVWNNIWGDIDILKLNLIKKELILKPQNKYNLKPNKNKLKKPDSWKRWNQKK